MQGFCVNFKDFNKKQLSTKGVVSARVPDGVAAAKEIPMNYKYSLGENEKDVDARLVIRCPQMKTKRGIVDAKMLSPGKPGKPAIQVTFEVDTNPDHALFVGTFGNQFDYSYDKKNGTYRAPTDSTPSTGVLGSIYDWCVEQLATYYANEGTDGVGKEEPNPPDYVRATSKGGIGKDSFFYVQRYKKDNKEGKKEGELIPDANPNKFFKLMTYLPGTPEENSAKFYLPDRTKVPQDLLRDRSYEFIPFLTFRRIFIGETVSVTMEVSESVIVNFLESAPSMSIRSSKLIEQLLMDNPEMADQVAEKFAAMMQSKDSTKPAELALPKKANIEIQDEEPVSPKESGNALDDALEEVAASRRDRDEEETSSKPAKAMSIQEKIAERQRQKPSRS